MICVVIQLADFIAAVEDRHTCLSEQERVKHNVKLDSFLLLELVLLILSSLDAAQRSGRTAHTGIAESRIIIVELAAGIGSPVSALQIIIDIFLVSNFFDAELLEVIKIETPADIIMAAQIVQEYELLRKRKYRIQLMLQQTHISCCDCIPHRAHRCGVVEHMALRLVNCTEIRSKLGRLHRGAACPGRQLLQPCASGGPEYGPAAGCGSWCRESSRYTELRQDG